jgi:hypothetical protein
VIRQWRVGPCVCGEVLPPRPTPSASREGMRILRAAVRAIALTLNVWLKKGWLMEKAPPSSPRDSLARSG